MSIRALTDIALERDAGVPPQPRARAARARAAADPAAAPAPAPGQTRTDVLVSAIPTEVLAPYTALVALIVSTIDSGESQQATLRWILYGVGFAAIALLLGMGYVSTRTAEKKRRFPVAEATAALVAFGAWGLVMPGTPLAIDVKGDDLTIATAIITAAGVFLVALMSNPLNKPAKTS